MLAFPCFSEEKKFVKTAIKEKDSVIQQLSSVREEMTVKETEVGELRRQLQAAR